MNLDNLIAKIDSYEISGYPVNEDHVIEKCSLIQEGLNILENKLSNEASSSITEFIKRIQWFGYEIGYNKALEMSEYANKQSLFIKQVEKLAPYEYDKSREP